MPDSSRGMIVLVVVLATAACAAASQRGVATTSNTTQRTCRIPRSDTGEPGAVAAARLALGDDGSSASRLRVDTVIHVSAAGSLYEGSIVRLSPRAPPPVHGVGGLVWVDGESNCTKVLKRYE